MSDFSDTGVGLPHIDFNPAREVEKPKGQSLHGEMEEMIILKPPEIRTPFDKAATQKDNVLFMTVVLTGAREGELIFNGGTLAKFPASYQEDL